MNIPVTQNQASGADKLSEILLTRPRGSHTHLPLEDIFQRLNIGSVERILLWLSKTDYYVLSLSTFYTRLTLVSLGLMVIFTTLLAFGSALYAILSTVVGSDNSNGWPIAIFLAGIYAFGIMIIDREIVGSISKKSLVIRLFFAIFIAIAVSYPVKMKFFEGRLNVEINRMVDEKNADKLAEINKLTQIEADRRNQQANITQEAKNELVNKLSSVNKEIVNELNRKGIGPKSRELNQISETTAQKLEALRQQQNELSIKSFLTGEEEARKARLQSEIDAERRISYDFLTKWEAMKRIEQASGSDYWVLSSFIMLFFMLLELLPMMLKWSLGKTEYHYYIESRTNLTNQKIISITNAFLAAMQENPLNSLNMPPEITSIIASQMEDESSEWFTKVDLRGSLDILRQSGSPSAVNPTHEQDRPTPRPEVSATRTSDPDATIDEPTPLR